MRSDKNTPHEDARHAGSDRVLRNPKRWLRFIASAALLSTTMTASMDARADARTDARRYFREGMALIAKSKYDEGIRSLRKAYEVLPHASVLYNIARAEVEAGKLEDAIATYREYLATDPPDRADVVQTVRGLEDELAKKKAEAAATETGRKHFTAGMALVAQGKYDEGVRELEQANAIRPHPNVTFNIARAWTEAKAYDKAISAYRQYLASDPPDRKQVEEIIADLERRRDAEKAAQAAAAAAAGTTSETPTPTPTPTDGAAASPTLAAKTEPFGPNDKAGQASKGGTAAGEARGDEVYEETVVTASRGAQSPLDAPNSTTIITRQDIELSGITRIPELLRRVAGMDVMQVSGGDSNVSMRGFNRRLSNKLLILVNGRSVYNDILGSTFWESLSIDVDQVERIEIVRGPGSALYGADAFSGVVNIITLAPGEGRNGVRVGVGDHATAYGSLWATGRDGDFAYRASTGYTRYPRWTKEQSPDRVDATQNFLEPDLGAENLRLDLRTSRRVDKDKELELGGGFARAKLDFYAVGPFNDYAVQMDNTDVTLAFNSPNIHLRTYYARLDAHAEANTAYYGHTHYGTFPVQNSVDAELELTNEFRLPEALHHDVHLGFGYRLKNIEWSYLIDEPPIEHHGAVFLQDAIKIGESFTFVAGGRLDYLPYLEEVQGSPRASVIIKPSDRQAIRAGVSTAFRQPTFLETYLALPIQLQYPGLDLFSQSINERDPDAKIQTERILSVEAGYSNQTSDYFEVDFNAYYSHITDLIVLAEPRVIDLTNRLDGYGGINPDTGRYTVAFGGWKNACETYDVIGGEVGTRVYPVEGLDVFANYALNLSSQNKPETCVADDDERTSKHKVNVGVQVRSSSGLNGEVSFYYQSAQVWTEQVPTAAGIDTRVFPLDSYTLVNGRLGYRFSQNRAEVSGTVFNALAGVVGEDGGPQMHPFGNKIGRRFMGFFTYSL